MGFHPSWRFWDRRYDDRLHVKVPFTEVVRDRPVPSMALDLSEGGLALRRLVAPGVPSNFLVGLELPLPGTGDVIWATAETSFASDRAGLHRAGLRFLDMPWKYRRLLRDFLMDRRLRLLALQSARRPSPLRRFFAAA